MIIQIMNRCKAKSETFRDIAPATAIISISGRYAETPILHRSDWLKGVLYLNFDDEDTLIETRMTEDDAEQICKFLSFIKGKEVKRLIVHCDAGVSRSAAVAAAIMKYLDGSDASIFNNHFYAPNMHCYKMTLNALMELKP